MNFFEQELRKIIEDSSVLDCPTFVGRVCYGDVGEDLRARIEFTAPHTVDHYSSLRITMKNRAQGTVDFLDLRLDELLGVKDVPGNENFPRGVHPYIWIYNGKAEWYAFTPTPKDYQTMRASISNYLDVFRTREDRQKESSLDSKLKAAASRAGTSHEAKSPSRQER